MSNELISVIVPVYNVEKYLDKCIESVVNQTYKNLEILLIDDGSPDNCPQICDEWAKRDDRIRVIHKKNGGIAETRNVGLDNISGEYITFVDSDDWIDSEMLSNLYYSLNENDCDIASCMARMIWDDGQQCGDFFPYSGVHIIDSPKYALECLIKGKFLTSTVWCKLFKKEVIKDTRCPVGRVNEDEYWIWQVYANSRKTICIDEVFYNYFQRNDSIMHGGDFNPIYALEAHLDRYKYICDNYPDLQDLCCEKLLYACLFQAQRSKLLLEKSQHKSYFKQIKSIVKSINPNWKKYKHMGLKKQIRMKSIYYSFGLVCFIQDKLNIGNKSVLEK